MAMARRQEALAEFATAADLLADEPEAAAELALVNAWMAEDEMFAGNPGPAADHAGRALASGAATEPVAIMALHIRGDSRIALGDPEGIEDLHEALDRAQALGAVSEIITSYSYLADREWQVEGPAVALRGWMPAASWPIGAERSARDRGPRSPRSNCWWSSADGTRCCPGRAARQR